MTSPFGPLVCAQSVRLYAVATSRRTFWFKASFEPPCPSGVFQSDPSLTPFSSYCHGGPGSGHAEEVVDERAPRHPLSQGDDESVGDRVVHEELLRRPHIWPWNSQGAWGAARLPMMAADIPEGHPATRKRRPKSSDVQRQPRGAVQQHKDDGKGEGQKGIIS